MSPIENIWDFVDGHRAHDPSSIASTDELWIRIQTMKNVLPQANFQNLFESMVRLIAPLIVAHGGY